jgi:hypothetical protein
MTYYLTREKNDESAFTVPYPETLFRILKRCFFRASFFMTASRECRRFRIFLAK